MCIRDRQTTVHHGPMPVHDDCLLHLGDRDDLSDGAVLPRPVFDVGRMLPWPGRNELALPGICLLYTSPSPRD
eukprot:7709287-Alexandrium_andersonii.AAC.1